MRGDNAVQIFKKLRNHLLGALMVFVSCAYSTENCFARDLRGRLGLGYNNEFSSSQATNGVPGISLKYGLSPDVAFGGIFGVGTQDPSSSLIALKYYQNVFFETNLNFYFLLGLGHVRANNQSGMELLAGFGSEFFIPGLESLGFSFELGGSLSNLSGSFALKTLGASFLDAGIHFYF